MQISIKIVTFENQSIFMKKFLIPTLLIAIFVVFYQQTLPVPNVYITCIGLVVFMLLMMKLNSKIPSKEKENQDNDV